MIRRTALRACTALLCVAALGGIASIAEAQDLGADHGTKVLADLEANATRLGIADETMAKIRAIVADGRASRDGIRAQLDAARATLRDLLSTPRPDETAVMAQARQIGALDTQLLELRLRTLLRVRPLLTDAQITALHAVRQQRLAPVRDACRTEIAASCADEMSGRGTVRCLRAHHAQLSDPCRAALAALHAGRADR